MVYNNQYASPDKKDRSVTTTLDIEFDKVRSSTTLRCKGKDILLLNSLDLFLDKYIIVYIRNDH